MRQSQGMEQSERISFTQQLISQEKSYFCITVWSFCVKQNKRFILMTLLSSCYDSILCETFVVVFSFQLQYFHCGFSAFNSMVISNAISKNVNHTCYMWYFLLFFHRDGVAILILLYYPMKLRCDALEKQHRANANTLNTVKALCRNLVAANNKLRGGIVDEGLMKYSHKLITIFIIN